MNSQSKDCGRRSQRKPVLLSASIEVDGTPVAVKLRNLSEEGALIEGDRLPAEGSITCFQRNGLRVPGTIMWVRGQFAGVAFARVLRHEEVLRHIPKPRPRVQPDVRRPGFTCRPLTAAQRKLLEIWSTEASIGPLGD